MLSVNSAASNEVKSSMMCKNTSAPQAQPQTVPTFGCLEDETNNDLKLDNNFGKLIDDLGTFWAQKACCRTMLILTKSDT